MADRKLMEEYENSVMSLAVSEMLEEYGRELEEEFKSMEDNQPSPEALEKFKKALDKRYRKDMLRSFGRSAAKLGRYAVTVCASLIVIFSVSVVSVDALRFRFLEWLNNVHESHNSIGFNTENKTYNDLIMPEYIPDGYLLTNYSNNKFKVSITFSNAVDKIELCIFYDATQMNLDNEQLIDYQEITVDNNIGYYQKKDSLSSLIWISDDVIYTISTTDNEIALDDLVDIAQSF